MVIKLPTKISLIMCLLSPFLPRPRSPQPDAADHLFKDGLIHGEFLFGRDECHVKKTLVIEPSYDPHDFRRVARVACSDDNGAYARLVAYQHLGLGPRDNSKRLISLVEKDDQAIGGLFKREESVGYGDIEQIKHHTMRYIVAVSRGLYAVNRGDDGAVRTCPRDLPSIGISQSVKILGMGEDLRQRGCR